MLSVNDVLSRRPVHKSLYTSAARTTAPTAVEFTTDGRQALHLVIDVTAISDSPSVTPTIAAHEPLSNKWYTLLTGSAITATGTTVLKIGPAIATLANAAAADYLPYQLRLSIAHADSDSITYTAAAILIG